MTRHAVLAHRAWMLAAVVAGLAVPFSAARAWTTVGTGIEYQLFQLPDPNNVFVTRMDRHNPLCYMETSLANGRIDGSTERVSGQFSRYDDAMAYWGQDWGRRNDVVAAINGDYWNTSTRIPLDNQIQGGWHIKGEQNVPCFGWTCDRRAVVWSPPWYNRRVTYHTGTSQEFTDVNTVRGADQYIIYTNHYGANTKTDSSGVEVLVEMMRPTMTLSSSDAPMGIVRQIRIGQGSTPIPFDHIVLSATGTPATTLQNNVAVGQPVYVTQSLQNAGYDFTRCYALMGGLMLLVSPAEQYEPLVVPMGGLIAPRSALCYSNDYIYFVVCDGRSSVSIGMDFTEIAEFCRLTLGANNAISLDGGGSSCLVVNGVVKNSPSDGSERAVPNGVLMCVMQEKMQSTAFNVGDTIKTTGSTTMRTGPGTNYLSLTSITSNSTGTILDHSLRGIYAKGANWWKCDINGYVGWVSQSALSRTATGNLPVFTQHPVDTTVCPTSGTAIFTVAATGTGTLSYQWLHHGANVTNGTRISGAQAPMLTITNLVDLDAGSYRCLVTDDIGTATSYSAALFLKAHTVVKQHPQAKEAYPLGGLGEVSFTVSATGEGTLSYQWQKGTQDLTDDGHSSGTATPTLTISGIDHRDVGDYRCRVSALCETVNTNYAHLTVYTGDLDADGDSDLPDFSLLQNCLGEVDPKVNNPECAKADVTGDGKVNTADVAAFIGCMTGQEIPLPPGC